MADIVALIVVLEEDAERRDPEGVVVTPVHVAHAESLDAF